MLQLDCNDNLFIFDGANAFGLPKYNVTCRNTKQLIGSLLTQTNFVTLRYKTDNWGTHPYFFFEENNFFRNIYYI